MLTAAFKVGVGCINNWLFGLTLIKKCRKICICKLIIARSARLVLRNGFKVDRVNLPVAKGTGFYLVAIKLCGTIQNKPYLEIGGVNKVTGGMFVGISADNTV